MTWQDLDGPDEYVKAVGIVRAFVETGDSVLAIIGRRGSGKTQVASTATWQTIEAGRSGRIVTASELASDLKRRFGADSDADGSWLRAWTVPHLLCVDEIAELVAGDVVRAAVTSLLDSRYRMCKPTLLAGNLEPGHFISVVGASVADRCREGGGIVLCNWPSFRGGNGGAERQAVRQAQAPE
ncbi:MAG: ATP-binding protein [Phycisphaerae bacterium]